MDEQTQAQFIEWLAANLGVQTEEELNAAIEQMGEEGLEQAFSQFQQQQTTQALKRGGQIDYFKKLKEFRKGGSFKAKMKDGHAKDCSAVGGRKDSKKKDKATAIGGRKDVKGRPATARAHQQGGTIKSLSKLDGYLASKK